MNATVQSSPVMEWTAAYAELQDPAGVILGEVPAWRETARARTKRAATIQLAREVCRSFCERLKAMGAKAGYWIRFGPISVRIEEGWLS